MKERKSVNKRRVLSLVLTLAMIVAMLPAASSEVFGAVTVNPTPKAYLELVAVNPDTQATMTATSLEIDDVVEYQIKATADLATDAAAGIGMISGYLDYSEDVFTQVVNSDFTPADGWGVYWDATQKCFSIQAADDVVFAAGDVICSVRMTVKRAVDNNVSVGICGSMPYDSSLDYIEIRQHNNSDETVLLATKTAVSLTNTVTENTRNFEMIVPDNLTFYTNTPASNKVVKIPVKIASGSVYAGFKISVTYNSSVVNYEGYELSDTAGAYVQMVTQSAPLPGTGSGIVTRNISLVSSKDINQAGEFMFLKFKTNSGVSAAVGGARITIKLYEAVNQSRAPMTYKLTAGTNTVAATSTTGTVVEQNIPLTFAIRDVVLGDVNSDGKINLVDSLLIMQAYNGIRTLSTVEGPGEIGTEEERADVNGTGTVTLVDALLILKYYNGEISSFT